MRDPIGRRLILILKFDRRGRVIAKPVRVARGSPEPLAGEAQDQPHQLRLRPDSPHRDDPPERQLCNKGTVSTRSCRVAATVHEQQV
jgi:hypothetical protein